LFAEGSSPPEPVDLPPQAAINAAVKSDMTKFRYCRNLLMTIFSFKWLYLQETEKFKSAIIIIFYI